MELQYSDIKNHGAIYPLLKHFSRFFWLHPKIAWIEPELQSKLLPCITLGIKEGLLLESDRKPWVYLSPAVLDRCRGLSLRPFQWASLRAGPPAHTAMIHRVAYFLHKLPSNFSLEIDEGIQEKSLPPGWGGFSRRVPDIWVKPPTDVLPSLWIECERTLKSGEDYRKKLEAIGRKAYVIYVTPLERQRIKLLERWPLPPRRHSRVKIINEIGAMAWLRAYCAYVRRDMAQPQIPLGLGNSFQLNSAGA